MRVKIYLTLKCIYISEYGVDDTAGADTKRPEWLPERQWEEAMEASKNVESLNTFIGHLVSHSDQWKEFYDSTDPNVEFPQDWLHLK